MSCSFLKVFFDSVSLNSCQVKMYGSGKEAALVCLTNVRSVSYVHSLLVLGSLMISYTIKPQCFILTPACLRREALSCRLPRRSPSRPQLAPPSSWK